MIQLTADEIREKYLEFFESKGHLRLPSYSLVPVEDPTLLIINAGMAPMKPYFKGEAVPPRNRVTTCQKCIRVGDIEQVGKTARHMTFFEMLGNFSFGDYYKEGSIEMAWEFMTEIMEIPKEKLYITIHTDDDEAEEIWHKKIGVPMDRIYRDSDNFWGPVGDTGPCGPCSELLVDQGPEFGCGSSLCRPGCDCDRYLELWNLVFTGLYKDESGKFVDLPSQCIDTGMGFERLTAYLQGKNSPYETELFAGVIQGIREICGKGLGDNPESDRKIKVVADHVRSMVFMAGDGITPSNEGRGYVMRRLIRRAVRFSGELGFGGHSLTRLVEPVLKKFGHVYPEILEKRDYIVSILQREEENFRRTLSQGLTLLENLLIKLQMENRDTISGREIFNLYDTYGLPVELTLDMARERSLKVDMEGFEKALEQQRHRARADQKNRMEAVPDDMNLGVSAGDARFIGYDRDEDGIYIMNNSAKVISLLHDGSPAEVLKKGQTGQMILDATSFYGESGGQVGDSGIFRGDEGEGLVTDTLKTPSEVQVHQVRVDRGELRVGGNVTVFVDRDRRLSTMRHHTATHLLQAALREIVGSHVGQMGSLVAPDYFRFDFCHHGALRDQEIQDLEVMVNRWILANLPVAVATRSLSEALEEGALAFFGEKYSDRVRLVKVPGVSAELCGGTHVNRTGDIGSFKIISESAIGMGIRRIEAVCGTEALKRFQWQEGILRNASGLLNTDMGGIPDGIQRMLETRRQLERELKETREEMLKGSLESHLSDAVDVEGVSLLTRRVDQLDRNELRKLADMLADTLKEGVVVLGSVTDGKVAILVRVTDNLAGKGLSAVDIVGPVASVVGGGGGGKPRMAQAGGKDPAKVDEALERAREVVKDQIGKMRIKS